MKLNFSRKIFIQTVVFFLVTTHFVTFQTLAADSLDAIGPSQNQQVASTEGASPTVGTDRPATSSANVLMDKTILRLIFGDPFDAQVRQTVWMSNSEIIGVGSLVHAGRDSGRFRMHMTMHDGEGRHTMLQTSDGRLTWTRSTIGEQTKLRRIDVSRLDQWVGAQVIGNAARVMPGRMVGGPIEMLDTAKRDYELKLHPGKLREQPVMVIQGELRNEVRQTIVQKRRAQKIEPEWEPLQPSRIRVVIATANDPKTGYGEGLPIRFEYWSDPIQSEAIGAESTPKRTLISTIQWHSVRQIPPPEEALFRYDHSSDEVDFRNETDRYLSRYGIRMTEDQRKLLRR